jgi:hypothetical protein
MFFFLPWQGILAFITVGVVAATVYTLWPIIKKRVGAKNEQF